MDAEIEYAMTEVADLARYGDGWKGPGSRGATGEATKQVRTLISKLARIRGERRLPMVGLDDEGIFVLTWREGDLRGNLSVRGNGFYSFAMRKGTQRYSKPRVEINGPLDPDLVKAITAEG